MSDDARWLILGGYGEIFLWDYKTKEKYIKFDDFKKKVVSANVINKIMMLGVTEREVRVYCLKKKIRLMVYKIDLFVL